MKHSVNRKGMVICLIILVSLGITSSLAFASDAQQAADTSGYTVVDFEGLADGALVGSLSSGNGISGAAESGEIGILAVNPRLDLRFGEGTNAAMIFDATCSPEGTPDACTGLEADMFKPELGNVLIASRDLDQSDPDSAGNLGIYFEFDFSGWGTGSVTVVSLDFLDIEDHQTASNPTIDLYSGGPGGTLLASVPVPTTGNNGLETTQIGVSGVDFMRVTTNGSGGIDNLKLLPAEVLYLVDNGGGRPENDTDDKSYVYRVEIDDANNQAILHPLPMTGGVAGELVGYNRVDALAATEDGSRIYVIDTDFDIDLTQNPIYSDKPAILAYYDLATATVVPVGTITAGGTAMVGIDQAAFSPDGTFYITNTYEDALYMVDKETAEATLVGTLVDAGSGEALNVGGGDVGFSTDGTFYVWINRTRGGALRGLYTLTLPAVNGAVSATYLGGDGSDFQTFRGFAFRGNGSGDLVGYTILPSIRVVSKADGSALMDLPMFLVTGEPFTPGPENAGDMSIGPFTP
jgi:hypothetical protein